MTAVSASIVDLEPQHAIAVRGEVTIAELPEFFGHAFVTVVAAIEAAGVEIVGPPFGFYPELPGDVVAVHAGFPVSTPVEPDGEAEALVLPGGRTVQAMHVGPYEALESTYETLQAWMVDNDIHPAAAMWESYLTEPEVEPDPAKWQTLITWPID